MKIRMLVALLLLAVASCTYFAVRSGGGAWGQLHDTPVKLGATGSECTVKSYTKIRVYPSDVVRWNLSVADAACQNKKIKIGDTFTTCDVPPLPAKNPFAPCGSANTADEKPTILCGVRDDAPTGCYSFTIGEAKADPEIEIGGPPNLLVQLLRLLLSLFGQSPTSH